MSTLPPARGARYRIGLVCLGNICRSPMAEVVLREVIDRAGLGERVVVDSCGTGAWHVGEPMDRRAAAALIAADYDPTGHRAQTLDDSWSDRDLLLAPLVAMVAIRRRRAPSGATTGTRPPIVPLFVVGFIAAVAVRSTGLLSEVHLDAISSAEKLVLTVALVGLGMGVRVDRMRCLGGRPLLLGFLSWMLVGAVAYIGTVTVT